MGEVNCHFKRNVTCYDAAALTDCWYIALVTEILLKSLVIYAICSHSLSLLCILQLPISSKIAHILMYQLWTEKLDMMSDEMLFKYSEYVLCHT